MTLFFIFLLLLLLRMMVLKTYYVNTLHYPLSTSRNMQFLSILPMMWMKDISTINIALLTSISLCIMLWCCYCRGGVTTGIFIVSERNCEALLKLQNLFTKKGKE